MPKYNFSEDIVVAEKTEKEMINLMRSTFGMVYISGSKFSDWDFVLRNSEGVDVSFEVKEDVTHSRTGNVGVEFESWGRPAGIARSKADFYIYKVHNSDGTTSVYVIRTSKLKRMIENRLYSRIICGGDKGSNSRNYLFLDSIFYANARKLA
jgi:hypothetical protein